MLLFDESSLLSNTMLFAEFICPKDGFHSDPSSCSVSEQMIMINFNGLFSVSIDACRVSDIYSTVPVDCISTSRHNSATIPMHRIVTSSMHHRHNIHSSVVISSCFVSIVSAHVDLLIDLYIAGDIQYLWLTCSITQYLASVFDKEMLRPHIILPTNKHLLIAEYKNA